MDPAIKHLHIVAYRGLTEVTIERPRQMNLFVGPNNSGKTSVLEAIALYARPLDSFHWAQVARSRLVLADRREWLESIRWMFPCAQGKPSQPIEFAGIGRHKALETLARCEEIENLRSSEAPLTIGAFEEEHLEEPKRVLPERGLQVVFRAELESELPESIREAASHTAMFWEDAPWRRVRTLDQLAIPVVSLNPFSHRVERYQVQALSTLTEQRRRQHVVEGLRLFDDAVEDIEIVDPSGRSSELRITHRSLGSVPVAIFGDGMRRALSLALGVLNAKDGVLLIDEIEAAIHVSALEKVLPWLLHLAKEHNVQVFASTHSLEAVDGILAALPEGEPELATYHMSRKQDAVQVKRYELAALRFMREERGLDIR